MERRTKDHKIAEWLEKLQQESWNLELLISGFSIFLLIQAGDFLGDFGRQVSLHTYFRDELGAVVMGSLGIAQLVSYILIINLLVHVFLRGFWIGAIGLRSVQEKVDFSKLKYSTFFTRKLKQNVSSLDHILIRLDNVCSIIFSFTFLVVFMFFSLFLGGACLFLVEYFGDYFIEQAGNGWFGSILTFITKLLLAFILFGGFLYMIDTLSLGFFKKFKWLDYLYYPVYLFFSTISMSFIYRGIYYSLINRFSKNQIRLFLVPYLLLAFFTPFFGFDQYIFFPHSKNSLHLRSYYYDDLRPEHQAILLASIPRQVIQEQHLPLFIRYNVTDNDAIRKQCYYEPSKKEGLSSGISFEGGNIIISAPDVEERSPDSLLNCLSSFYEIRFNDTTLVEETFYFFEHPNQNELGIYSVLDVSELPFGKNVISIKKRIVDSIGAISTRKYVDIPFWKE